MTTEASPKLLVVSSPDDREELVASLRQGGFAKLHLGDGGDDTLAQARSITPDVVVLCAGLEHGDARSLASALRREERPAPIVLVGQRTGPVRNALDAAAFDIDQFVGRPLSVKALAFAVTRCAQAAAHWGDPIARATDVAIDQLVCEAMAALPTAPVSAPAGPDEVTANQRLPVPGQREDEGEEEMPPWREPTVVIHGGSHCDHDVAAASVTGGQKVADPATRAPKPSRIGLAELAAMDAVAAAPAAAAMDAVAAAPAGDDLSEPGDDLGDAGEVLADDNVYEGDGDGGFAGELRRKMSQMAQRLFPGQRVDTGRAVDLGLAHGAHADIDLAQLGVDTVVGQREDANLIGGELDPSSTLSDAETRVPADGSSSGEAQASSDPGTTGAGARLPTRGEIGGAGTDVATILAEHYRGGFTGHVLFCREGAEKRVHFVKGRPVFATSNLPHDRMGELLCREGKITRAQRARCREAVVESGRRMGEILVEMGFLKRRELLPAVRRHVEDIIYSVFSWNEGEYVAIPEDIISGEKIRLSRHPAALILEGVRRKYSWRVLEDSIGTPEAIVVTGAREHVDEILASADLTRSERALVTSLGGDQTLGEAAADNKVDLLLAYQLGFGLMALGAAQLLHKGGESRAGIDTAKAPSLVGETDLAIDRQRVLAKRSLVDEADYFTLLGVRRDSTRFEIHRAYEAARREYAPGSFAAEVRDELGDAIDEINRLLDEAFCVLDDDDLRAAYLAHLRD